MMDIHHCQQFVVGGFAPVAAGGTMYIVTIQLLGDIVTSKNM